MTENEEKINELINKYKKHEEERRQRDFNNLLGEQGILKKWVGKQFKIIEELSEYYNNPDPNDDKKYNISVANFDCKHEEKCCGKKDIKNPEWCRGSEAYIGLEYGKDPEIPKIVVVSLDRGGGAYDLWERFKEIEGLVIDEEKKHKDQKKGEIIYSLNPHMLGTLRMLNVIFNNYNCTEKKLEDITIDDNNEFRKELMGKENNFQNVKATKLFRYFAMLNMAKCCKGNGMERAHSTYFTQCSDYIKGEIDELCPDIIILQGGRVVDHFSKIYKIQLEQAKNLNSGKSKWYEWCGRIKLNKNQAEPKYCFVINSIHPSATNKTQLKGYMEKTLSEQLNAIIQNQPQ